MNPTRRWLAKHPGAAKSLALAAGALLLAGVLGGGWWIATASERAAKDAAQTRQQLDEQAAAGYESALSSSLPVACDPLLEVTSDVYVSWTNCTDLAVAEMALLKVPSQMQADVPRDALERLANETLKPDVALRISFAPGLPKEIAEVLVERFESDVVPGAYKAVYSQICSLGVSPETYVGGTRWEGGGRTVVFSEAECLVEGIPSDNLREGSLTWTQAQETVMIGPDVEYRLKGDTLTLVSGRNSFPENLELPDEWRAVR